MQTLSPMRKADRQEMLRLVMDAARKHHATAEMHEVLPDCVEVRAPGGLCASFDIEPDCPLTKEGTYCVPWFISHDSAARLAPAFDPDKVNPVHHRKATVFVSGFGAVLAEIERGCCQALTGIAYQAPA